MELNYKSFGQGDPIIILHGLFGTLDNWQTIAKQLAEDYMVYIIDLRNHGKSPHAAPMTYPQMAEDIQQFLENNWIYEANIIGHSMGGKVAMQLALSYPDLVKNLIVVDIAPKQYPGGHYEIFDALFALDLTKVEGRNEADNFLKERIKDFGVRQFLLKNLSRNKEGGYRWKMNLAVIYDHYQDILAPIQSEEPFEKPTLFIRGGQSDYIQADDLDTITELFPVAIVDTVLDAGHWVHAQAPEELMSMVYAHFG
ncbi:MAG: alpha/beta fold hydrolase [Saprospiraceae bacterium]|nr:alpha/beta fold hydrolase [Saprospiraceae bacterium]